MLPDDVESYVREIARLLAPDGMCVASYFLLNDETRTGVDAGRSFLSFGAMHPSGLCRCTTRPQPKPRSLLKSHSSGGSTSGPGLHIREVRRGGWWSGTQDDQNVLTVGSIIGAPRS